MNNTIFVVHKEPYCLWEDDLLRKNQRFLDGIDVDYLDYILRCHALGDDDKRAAIALRSTMFHAIETMYSLIGAYVQGPLCAYAWIAKCSNTKLKDLLRSVTNKETDVPTVLQLGELSWENIAIAACAAASDDEDRNGLMASRFAKFWAQMSIDYLDQNNVDEYNSIKHGFRIRAGGFSMNLTARPEFDADEGEGKKHEYQGSEYGTSFRRMLPANDVTGNRSIISEEVFLNWNVENVISSIELISASITNITSALKIANGISPEDCWFLHPDSDDDINEPWQSQPDIQRASIKTTPADKELPNLNKGDLLKRLEQLTTKT